MAKKFSKEDIYRLEDAYNTDELISPAHNQAKMGDMIRGVKTRTIEEGLKEDIKRDIARKSSPLFEVNSTTITTPPKKKPAKEETVASAVQVTNAPKEVVKAESTTVPKETPTKDSTALWWEDMLKRIRSDASYAAALKAIEGSATTTELEEEQIGHDPLAEEDDTQYDVEADIVTRHPELVGSVSAVKANDLSIPTTSQAENVSAITPVASQPQTTTPQTTTTTTSVETDFDINKDGVVDNTETLIGITKQGNQQRMDALKVLQEAQAKGLSAYQTLLNNSLKRKEEVAKKQERNARSQAIANALGSLVNVITAGAIAKRNGTIPIVAEYDGTADSALRKSIEQRYALANENENLLMNLENERRKHEAEVARQNYAQEIASIDAETKAKIAPIAQQIALEEYEQKAKIRANAEAEKQKGVHDHKVENPTPPKNDGGKPKPKPFKYDKAKIDQFVAETTTWDYEEDDPVVKGRKVKKTHTSKPSSAESNVAEQVAKYCQENKVSDNVTSVLSEVYRKLFQTIKPEVTKKFGNDLTESIISAIKAGRNADEAYNVAKTYIEENK